MIPALYSQTQATFNSFVTSGTVVNNYAHIFDLLIRLRQAVNHPWLVRYVCILGTSISDLKDLFLLLAGRVLRDEDALPRAGARC